MLVSEMPVLVSSPSFHTGQSCLSKAQKRRKDNKLAVSPHLKALQAAAAQSGTSSKKLRGKSPCQLCLDHFDQFYGKTFGSEWPSLRLALLSRPKFAALVNKYAASNVEQTKTRLMKMGCYSVTQQYKDNLQEFLKEHAPPADDKEIKPPEKSAARVNASAQASRPNIEELSGEETPIVGSMSEAQAAKRLISPEEQVFAGGGDPHLSAASAAMFDHIPPSKLIGMEDFIEESEYYDRYQKVIPQPDIDGSDGDFVTIEMKKMPPLSTLPFDVWTFPSGSTDLRLEAPKRYSDVGCHDYYCMDLASLLPVIMLDVRPGHDVLDCCAAPGGKSLAILQNCLPNKLVCNDNQRSRLIRVRQVMHAYLQTDLDGGTDFSNGVVQYSSKDAAVMGHLPEMAEKFDRVLCDVECTTDRHSLHEPEGNWFKPAFQKLRIQLPERQSAVLQSSLKCLKVGGSLVYSTCSLSPVQNDGVVYDALRRVWADTSMDYMVNDLSDALSPWKGILKSSTSFSNMRYGQLVLPNMLNNFGPMYFSKITRTN